MSAAEIILAFATLTGTVFSGLAAIYAVRAKTAVAEVKADVQVAAQSAAVKAEEVKVDVQIAAARAAVKADEVKRDLAKATVKTEAKLEVMGKVAAETHVLVNGNMSAQLELNASVTRRLAALTKEPADEEIATKAEKAYRDHEAKQAKVDAQTTPSAERTVHAARERLS